MILLQSEKLHQSKFKLHREPTHKFKQLWLFKEVAIL